VRRIIAALLGVLVVAVAAVVAVDAWRAWDVHPQDCGSFLLERPRGDQLGDIALQAAAWTALTDPPAGTIGDLGGSAPTLTRSCLL